MGSLNPRPPGSGQVWGFRVALVTALFMNLVALWLLLTRPGTPPPATSLTPAPPSIVAAAPSPTPRGPTIGPPGGVLTPPPSTPGAVGGTSTPLPLVLNPGGKKRGVNIPVWGPDFIVARPSIQSAPALGANWVSLVSHWYVRSAVPITDGQIFREDGDLDNGAQRTASDASLARAIDNAHAQGLKVMLKPHVDWTEGGWRGNFYFDSAKGPDGRQSWWSSYHEMISATVRLALDHQVEAIAIGTEFNDINKEPASAAQWIGIIDQIRAAGYTGQLTYAANWGVGADAEYNRPGLQGVWEQLDFIGIDAYYPLSDERDPSVDQMVAGWRRPLTQWDQGAFAELELLHQRTGKPVVFTEVGYPAVDYGAKNPANDGAGTPNLELQSRAAQALYQVWENVPWWDGAFWWQYGPIYNSHSLQGRPILDTLHQIWATQAQR